MKSWIVVGCLVLAADYGWAASIVTTQRGTSLVEPGGFPQVQSGDLQTDGFVSVFALFGTNPTFPEARTAARSGLHEMAVNARIDDKFLFSFTGFVVRSEARYSIGVAPGTVFVDQAVVDFVLPASFLEVSSFVEAPSNELHMIIDARLLVCFDTACGLFDDTRFSFQARLDASFNNFSLDLFVAGDPSLDLTPLQNPTVTDSTAGGVRTTTIEFPFFQGHLELGSVPTGTPLTLDYEMLAEGFGIAFANVGLAAINDPFLLATDPVQQADPLTLTLTQGPITPVPAPDAWLLCLTGVAAVLLRSAWRRRNPDCRPPQM
jgi:hypothetical protein